MTKSDYETVWLPKVKAYLAKRDKEVEPYKSLINGINVEDEHFNAFEEQIKLLTKEEIYITTLTARQLVQKQKDGELTAVEIYKAFSKRGALAQLFTNCAVDLFFEEGLERARELDKYREEKKKLVGPYHGVPICLKELMKYGGKITHAGYVCFIENLIENSPRAESISIQIFRKQGAVFYMREAQPQTVMHLDTTAFHGRTTNPFNRKLSPGGSSGGTGAAVALYAAPVGIGSDIGGSVRVPAAFCGTYGLRPTTKRLTGLNSLSGGAGQESILSTQGPITNNLDDIEYYMENYINVGKPWLYDPNTIPLPWRHFEEKELPEAITIGIAYTDTLVAPSDAIVRGLDFVKDKLKAFQGKTKFEVKLIKFDHEKMKVEFEQNLRCYGQSKPIQLELLQRSGEPVLPNTELFLDFAAEDNDVLTNNIVKEKAKLDFHYLFEDESIDFLLCPTSPNVADIPKNLNHWNYSSFFNMIDFPNIVFPTGLTYDPKIDVKGPTNISDYDPEDYVNAPIALQLTGKRFEDEKLVAVTRIIKEAIGYDK